MTAIRARQPEAAAEGALPAGRIGPASSSILLVTVVAGFLALGIGSGPSDGLVPLTGLVALAMLGAFFLFGLATGLVRVGESAARRDAVERLLDSVNTGILITDGNGDARYVNNDLALSIGELLSGNPKSQRLDQSASKAHEALFRLIRAAERGQAIADDISLGNGHGSRWLRIEARLWPGSPAGSPPLILWQIWDLTEDRGRQQETIGVLQGALRRYDDGPVGVLTAAHDGSLIHVNTAFARLLGSTPHRTVLERDIRLDDIFSRDDLEVVLAGSRGEAGVASGVDVDLFREDGTALPVRAIAQQSDDGCVIAVVPREEDAAAGRDETLAEVRFARFFRSAPFGIATVGPDGRLLSANAAFSRMMLDGGSSAGEAAAEVLSRHAKPEISQAIDNALKHVLAGRGKLAPIDILIDGAEQRARRLYLSPVSGSRRAREAAVVYSIDSTEQKALEAKLAQSQKMDAVGKLAGGIAHDFNNVLTVIIGYSDILLQSHKQSDPAYQEIRYIKSSAERAAALVGKLLAFSRQQTMQAETLHIEDMLTDLSTTLLKRSIGETIDLSVSAGRDVWPVKADKIQLEQVLVNLVVNARDAMPGGGSIAIAIRNVTERESQRLGRAGLMTGEYVLVEVVDTGTGMPPDVLAKIFEPFFTTKGVGKGTGLGLSTVYGAIKQMGGFIFADSVVGEGTSFRIYLPRHHVEAEEEAAVVPPKTLKKDKRADLTGTGRVLLVEDEDMVRGFAVRALKSRGYEVLEASTGVEALEVMERHNGMIDIVVSDVVMPEMDGPTLLKELRKTRPDLKIVFVSGYPNEAFKASLDEDEQFGFLAKPFSLPQLAAKVKEELAR